MNREQKVIKLPCLKIHEGTYYRYIDAWRVDDAARSFLGVCLNKVVASIEVIKEIVIGDIICRPVVKE